MDNLLSPVSTTYTSGSKAAPSAEAKPPDRQQFRASSADEALEIFQNEPDYDTLISVLRFLLANDASFDVHKPAPLSSRIVHTLVTIILPNYWALLREEHPKDDRKRKNKTKGGSRSGMELFLDCLRSLTGLNVLLVRLRALLAEAKTGNQEQTAHATWQLRALVQVLSELLAPELSVMELWTASASATDPLSKLRPLTREFASVLGGGRIVSLAAEAEAVIRENPGKDDVEPSWVADGRAYSRWLTRGIEQWTPHNTTPDDQKLRGMLMAKVIQFGYFDTVVSTLVVDLLIEGAKTQPDAFSHLLSQLSGYEQKKILSGALKCISESYIHSPEEDASTVSAVASLIKRAIGDSRPLFDQLVSWIEMTPAVGWQHGIAIRRAALAVMAADMNSMSVILEKAMAEFGDILFIKHTPAMQQEAKAQILLLSAGYVYRSKPRTLAVLLRSRVYLDIVSNRLGSSQHRVRFLGMVVGEAISSLVDDSQKKLDFHVDEMDSEDALWYKGLVQVSDTIGSIDLLLSKVEAAKKPSRSQPKAVPAKLKEVPATTRRPVVPQTTGFVIEEVDDSDEDDDLAPYGAPDSDAEDSDDDPTMIRRDKPKAPVYIRDLITYFRDTENYDRQKLALATAPALIRRKANFGTEVQQHAQDLASILIGLHDSFEMDDFYKLRMESMVALVVAQPKLVGPWLAATFFEGDYSLSQRASVLTALGLSAREMAGFETSEYASAAAFPSKQLPARMESLYLSPDMSGGRLQQPSSLKTLPPGALDTIADSLTASILGPIAAKAADEATGPDVLKLSSFKSRMETSADKTTIKKAKHAVRPAVANTAAHTIATAFFFPLIGRFQLALQAASSTRRRGVLFEPSLLSLYIKTLAVVLHATGPSALALPDMTTELWSLLLGSRVQAQCAGDVLVTQAVLFALLALLDVNEGRMRSICRDMAREVVQTRDWLLQVLEATGGRGDSISSGGGGGGGDQESEIRMLAAGTYLRLNEGMESYRSLLLGEMIG